MVDISIFRLNFSVSFKFTHTVFELILKLSLFYTQAEDKQ